MSKPERRLPITGSLAEIAAAVDKLTCRDRSAFSEKVDFDNLRQLEVMAANLSFSCQRRRQAKLSGFFVARWVSLKGMCL